MMRGSGDLLQQSAQELVPVVRLIAQEPASTWDFDALGYEDEADEILALSRRIRKAFTINASDTLVTKTMLGVFGCVPAFDRFFQVKGAGELTTAAYRTALRAFLDSGHPATVEGFASYIHNASPDALRGHGQPGTCRGPQGFSAGRRGRWPLSSRAVSHLWRPGRDTCREKGPA